LDLIKNLFGLCQFIMNRVTLANPKVIIDLKTNSVARTALQEKTLLFDFADCANTVISA